MPSLITMRILNDIYTVFNESDFDLRTNRIQREKNLDKLQICININGTATVVAPCSHGKGLYMTFEGYGRVDLWDGLRSSCFDIAHNEYTAEEIRKQFHEKMTADYGLEFKNGEHQLYSPNWPGMLCSAKIIPQIYRVFQEDDFNLPRSSDPARLSLNKRFSGHVDPEGKLVIRAWIERQWARKVDHVNIIFDGSDTVTIAKYPYNDGEKFPIQEAREVLINTYGVSFKKPGGDPDQKETYDRVQLDHFVLE